MNNIIVIDSIIPPQKWIEIMYPTILVLPLL